MNPCCVKVLRVLQASGPSDTWHQIFDAELDHVVSVPYQFHRIRILYRAYPLTVPTPHDTALVLGT